MDVFVRWRPLLGPETTDGEIDCIITRPSAPSFSPRLGLTVRHRLSDRLYISSDAFSGIIPLNEPDDEAYSAIIQPTVPYAVVTAGARAAYFAYGPSGGGKTHTIIGYENAGSPGSGLCLKAAEGLFHCIDITNAHMENHPPLAIALRMFELRQKAVFDLFNGGTQFSIREGQDGQVQIGSETETLPDGSERVCTIGRLLCATLADLRAALGQAFSRRVEGTSSFQNQSSRTHTFIELEVVNAALVAAHQAIIDRQTELIPVRSYARDVIIAELARGRMRNRRGRFRAVPGYVINQALLDEVEAEKSVYEARVPAAEAEVAALYAKYNGTGGLPYVGGKMVFVDLADSKYHRERGSSLSKAELAEQTRAERSEARQINIDFLALKRVMRAWSTGATSVLYRMSPLTMALCETFEYNQEPENRRRCSATVVVTVSPAMAHHKETLNALKFGDMISTWSH